MFRLPLATSCNEIPIDRFWNAVLLYHDRPHLVNRRLTGSIPILFLKVGFNNNNIKSLSEAFTRSAILYEIRKLQDISKESITKQLVRNILETYDKNLDLDEKLVEDFFESREDIFVSVRILLPRQQVYEKCVEIAILDKKNKIATFFAVTEIGTKALAPPFSYDIDYVALGNLRICVQSFDDAETASAEWLSDVLFPKLLKWAENYDGVCEIQKSLSLVGIETYTNLYHSLKTKYGEKIIKIWSERTDPYKFVYEDIAIATYLISLWERTNSGSKPSFVDLGCGNGLLVYILNEEGFPGYGIDVRKRKIWDWYPQTTTLKVQTITPSANFLFPETNWIIGNHSDELTPWIPVIAARSSYTTNFFLLPCCCYEFSGQKYKRINSSISIYTEYLEYIQDVCKKCGYITQPDRLRIPSTRRTCIVSFGRSYEPEKFNEIDKNIADLIGERFDNNNEFNVDKSGWTNNFQARTDTERVRNCTQLDRNLVSSIVLKISKLLLTKNNLKSKSDGQTWNAGGTIALQDLAVAVAKEELKQLKSECGGLQTLLRNHRYIFELAKGFVKFRVPCTLQTIGEKYKNKPCWFYNNHPDGCLYENQICCYKH